MTGYGRGFPTFIPSRRHSGTYIHEYGAEGAPYTEIAREDHDGDGVFESTQTNSIGYEPSDDAIAQVVTSYF